MLMVSAKQQWGLTELSEALLKCVDDLNLDTLDGGGRDAVVGCPHDGRRHHVENDDDGREIDGDGEDAGDGDGDGDRSLTTTAVVLARGVVLDLGTRKGEGAYFHVLMQQV
jgi:hypothetical protein